MKFLLFSLEKAILNPYTVNITNTEVYHMWCPNCKNEYRAGITVCPDCNIELVEELSKESNDDYVSILKTYDSDLKDRVVKYLASENIDVSVEEKETDEDTLEALQREFIEQYAGSPENMPQASEVAHTSYELFVHKSKKYEAVKEVRAIIKVETEKKLTEIMEKLPADPDPHQKEEKAPAKTFVKAKDRSNDYASAGTTFLTFGILLLSFIILNIAGVIKYFTALYSQIVIVVMSVAFIVLGVLQLIKSRKIAEGIQDEETQEEKIKAFLKNSFTKETLDAMREEGDTDELLFLKQNDALLDALKTEFATVDESELSEIADEYLNGIYE